MSFVYVERPSDSPYLESITHGYPIGTGTTIRPAEIHWHMVFSKDGSRVHPLFVGALTSSGVVSFTEGMEILWIKFKLGTYIPHLPARNHLDKETLLPTGAGQSFWLKSSTWEIPSFDNVETFVSRLAREDILRIDPVVSTVLAGRAPKDIASRTVRHRFLNTIGLTQNHIYQFQRARQAEALLRQGTSILDTVYEVGYFDQPHLTRSLKQWIGHTPAQVAAQAG